MLQKVTNKPNNHIVKDATTPYTFEYIQYGIKKTITVHQTAKEETWPGGALWDIGILLAKVLVMVNKPPPPSSSYSAVSPREKREKYVSRIRSPGIWPSSWKDATILELGCGVGLTGLVGAQLGAKLTVLTDLDIVIDSITTHNLEINKKEFGKGQTVVAVPLCWGREGDESSCRELFQSSFATTSIASRNGASQRKKARNKNGSHNNSIVSQEPTQVSDPNIIIIGDVAYQHKPGAPSHFDALLSTVLKFTSTRKTLVMFGTRMRMPASADLLDMLRDHFEEIVEPVEAHEIDESFHSSSLGRNSMITVHFFKRKLLPSVKN
jgi:predicted nicotinamide N-methyase